MESLSYISKLKWYSICDLITSCSCQAVKGHFEAFIASVLSLLVFMNMQLDRCQEGDCGRVFEINLNGQALEHVPDLKEVGLLLELQLAIL